LRHAVGRPLFLMRAIFPLNALSVEIFGVEALPKVLGLLGLITIPFTFAMPLAAGWLYDLSGNYRPVSTAFVTACLVAAMTFFAIGRRLKRHVEAKRVSQLRLWARLIRHDERRVIHASSAKR
jgi:membrane protein DedA with SNARE-associated domain